MHPTAIRRLAGGLTTLAFTLIGSVGVAGEQTGDALRRAVEEALRGDRALRNLEVWVEGDQVTVAGDVRTFWEKNEALRRTLGVEGVETVVSEIVVPVADDEDRLAEEVVRAIQNYAHYRIWDYLEAGLNNGVVTLGGWVTPERDKARELFERIAKIRGVQDVQTSIEVLPTNQGDVNLRNTIGRRLSQSEHFERFRSAINTPFHIIVQNSVVTLVGYVQNRIQWIVMERIVAQTHGVLRVENQLQTLR